MRQWQRLGVLGATVGVSLVLLAMPVSSKPIRLTQLVLIAIGLAATLSIVWPWSWARLAACTLVLVPFGFILAPGREVDEATVRLAYISELTEMVGVRYVWGGEGRGGIDCSGLPRKALLDATLKRGLATANPTLLRRAVRLWWNDLSASAIGASYRRSTVAVSSGEAIQTLDVTPVVPGDLAVTSDGVHLLVYIGEGRWIQADPLAGEVITVVAQDDNSWLRRPVNVVRWSVFA